MWDGGAIASALVVTFGDCSGMQPTFEACVPPAATFHSKEHDFNSGRNPIPDSLPTHKRKSYTKDAARRFSYDGECKAAFFKIRAIQFGNCNDSLVFDDFFIKAFTL
ncbi:hypothetical protein [Paenibacillus radicis (ex Xue et al. 2023)]|uniref:Uncharacterized protein n=1 Tax=Paenibacillus radicis (ex Xue et al. 2023) TaxID=2972489 RepID=A0ABT1YRA8_9BACL|nr:hypothetical protein [Paenibacillus radicis (ex Xue et al. 2023)]MCR8635562.1 hypothetical protein [Paenibacillus radicis (ex Xue et al. 2023)]